MEFPSFPNVDRIIKSVKVGWVERRARREQVRNTSQKAGRKKHLGTLCLEDVIHKRVMSC